MSLGLPAIEKRFREVDPRWRLAAACRGMDAPTLFDVTPADVLADTPGAAHHDGRPTEHAAAAKVRTGSQKAACLMALAAAGADGLTDWELSVRAHIRRPHVAGTRRAELQRLGLVEQSDLTRATDTGCKAVVWIATDEGLRVAREMAS